MNNSKSAVKTANTGKSLPHLIRSSPFDSESDRSSRRVAAQDDFPTRVRQQMLHDFQPVKHRCWRYMFGSQAIINRNQFTARR